MEVAAIIPAYNESLHIGDTVAALKNIPAITDILVVDDGSGDDTAGIASSRGARVLRLDRNRGKGYAICRGLPMVSAPIVLLVDGDLGASAGEVGGLLGPVQVGDADMAVAVLPPCRKGGWGLVKKLAAWSVRRSCGRILTEPLSGQRALRKELWELLRYPPRGFGLEVGLTLDILSQGCTILEVPTMISHRERGRDILSILHRLKQMSAVLWEIYLRRQLLYTGGRRV